MCCIIDQFAEVFTQLESTSAATVEKGLKAVVAFTNDEGKREQLVIAGACNRTYSVNSIRISNALLCKFYGLYLMVLI